MKNNQSLRSVFPSNPRVGWIGAGVMGAAMCEHVLGKGYRVTVHSRTPAKTKPLLDKGAAWADSSKAVAERSDVVFTMVGFPRDVRDVYFGEAGLLAGARAGNVLVDMTTAEPSLARKSMSGPKPKTFTRWMRLCPAATWARATPPSPSWRAATRKSWRR